MNIKITGSGSYIPTEKVTNLDFAKHSFLNEDGSVFPYSNEVVAEKFLEAAESSKPKLRYPVGKDAVRTAPLRRFAPVALFDKIFRSTFKLD